jgi:hypothetical protein
MKELTIEQKAKAYDEALERAKRMFSEKEVNYLFPQFKESNDEKTKRILHSISSKISFHLRDIFTEEEFQCFDAWSNTWLKKQGEKKATVDTKVIIPKFCVGDIVKSKSQPMLRPRKIISIGKDCYWCEDRGCIGFAWEDDYDIVEQNPSWSEEDRDYYDAIIAKLELTRYDALLTDNQMAFLKSFKDRYFWKPTDAQIASLTIACDRNDRIGFDLTQLLRDLKKLKE